MANGLTYKIHNKIAPNFQRCWGKMNILSKKFWIATEKMEKRLLPGSGETDCRRSRIHLARRQSVDNVENPLQCPDCKTLCDPPAQNRLYRAFFRKRGNAIIWNKLTQHFCSINRWLNVRIKQFDDNIYNVFKLKKPLVSMVYTKICQRC